MCKKICTRFNEPYVPFQKDQEHREVGSCRTPRGHPGGDLLKSTMLKAVFPYTIEFKTKKILSATLFSKWIQQSIRETPENEDFVLVLHKHNSLENAVIMDTKTFIELARSLASYSDHFYLTHYDYKAKKFSTKAFWETYLKAKEDSKEDFIISFKSRQLDSQLPEMTLSITDFDYFLKMAFAKASLDERLKHLLQQKEGESCEI